MLKKSKKVLSLLLTLILVFSTILPIASAEEGERYPVVYMTGYGSPIYAEKGNQYSEKYYPTGADVGASNCSLS